MKLLKYVAVTFFIVVLAACGGGGGNASAPIIVATAPTTPAITPNSTVATIRINSSASVLNADGTSSLTFTIFALTSGNGSVVGATVDLAATNAVILSKSSVVTTEISPSKIWMRRRLEKSVRKSQRMPLVFLSPKIQSVAENPLAHQGQKRWKSRSPRQQRSLKPVDSKISSRDQVGLD